LARPRPLLPAQRQTPKGGLSSHDVTSSNCLL
jgi:hypothetical protein